jgi:hypothetical protein
MAARSWSREENLEPAADVAAMAFDCAHRDVQRLGDFETRSILRLQDLGSAA